jgi:haloalkane dehalogenase
MFRAYRDPVQGRKLLIDENAFINLVLPRGLIRQLTDTEMSYYSSPFLRREDHEPLSRFPNEVPVAGEPADMWEIAQANHAWLLETEVPKIFLGTPGA